MSDTAKRAAEVRDQIELYDPAPATLFNAVGELAMAIKPHSMDVNQRKRIAAALHTLVAHILEAAAKEQAHD